MDVFDEIKKHFHYVVSHSLNADQINYLGRELDGTFDLYKVSGVGKNIPITRQDAAEVLLDFFNTEENMLELFAHMLGMEGRKIADATVRIIDKNEFLKLVARHKWVYDKQLNCFYRDPFYEHEINFLRSIRLIDLRQDYPTSKIIDDIHKASEKLSMQELEWQITARMYELNEEVAHLMKKIIEMLLTSQNLKDYAGELYMCFKELAINASKANYKILFEKYYSGAEGVNSDENYNQFLEMFKKEIADHGNTRLLELAQDDDMYFSVFFQSTMDSIAIWVANYSTMSKMERKRILHKIKNPENDFLKIYENDPDEYSEGYGFGINLILNILRHYSDDPYPLKIIFYPDSVKVGFELKRSELRRHQK